jgi:hypothetical protein
MKKVGINLIIVVITILLINLAIAPSNPAPTPQPTPTPEEINAAKYYAENLEKFLAIDRQESKLQYNEQIQAFLDSLKSSGNEEAFYEAWTEYNEDKPETTDTDESKIPKISDKAKNQIWQYLAKQEKPLAQDYLKKLAQKSFEKKYKDIEWNDDIKRGIDKVILSDPSKLKWHGNKVGFENEQGKLTTWLDMENIPNWVKEIKTTENGFDLTLNTGQGNWNLDFNQGSVGSLLEAIGPNGNTIGVHRNNGLTGIEYNKETKEFRATYNFFGDPREVKFKLDDLTPKVRAELDELIENNPEKKEMLNNVLEKIQDNVGLNLLSKEAKTKYGLAHENTLSFAIQNPEGSKISLSYDEAGKPQIKTNDKATFATLNSNLDIERTYKTLPGKNEGTFSFDKQGNLLEGTGVRVESVGFASIDAEEKTGFHIIRSTLADAIARGDEKAVVESVIKDYKLIERKLNGNIDLQTELVKILDHELKKEGTSIETKAKLQEAREFYTENIRQAVRNIGEYLITGGETLIEGSEQSKARDAFLQIAESEIEKQVEYLLKNPEELQKLISADTKEASKVAQKLLGNIVSSPEVRSRLGGDFLRNTLQQYLGTSIDTQNELQGIVGGVNFQKYLESKLSNQKTASSNDMVDSIIAEYPLLEGQKDAITNIIQKATQKIDSEVDKISEDPKDLLNNLEKRMKGNSNFVVLNEDRKNIYAKGQNLQIEAISPLNKFIVENTATGTYDPAKATHLYNRGNHVLSFYGENTYTTRVVESNQNFEFASINEIINGKKSTNNRVILNNPNGYYEIYDPSDLFRKQYASGGNAHTTKSFLFFTFDINIPFTSATSEVVSPRETDIGEVEGAGITINRNTQPHPTGAFKGAKTKGFYEGMNAKYPNGVPLSEELGTPIYNGFHQQMQSRINQAGGKIAFNQDIAKTQKYITHLQNLGISVPLEATDQVYLAQHPESFDRVYNFFNSLALPNGGSVEIRNNHISVYGNGPSGQTTYTLDTSNVHPSVFRSIMREIQKNPSRLQNYQYIEG